MLISTYFIFTACQISYHAVKLHISDTFTRYFRRVVVSSQWKGNMERATAQSAQICPILTHPCKKIIPIIVLQTFKDIYI